MSDFHVISIGALEANPLWDERAPVRTGHATTTLILADGKRILVDPGLPAQAIAARLGERINLTPNDITDVFLTSFKPDTMRGIRAFGKARWWISEAEREGVGVPLIGQLTRAAEEGESDLAKALERDVAVLRECRVAEDSLADAVDLFPLPGVTPGTCGLLIAAPRFTALVTGDAVPTGQFALEGRVPRWAADVDKARESFADAIEIADLLIPGRDNLIVNPTKRPF